MNQLAGQTSPYLKQHTDNPVDWWPWCAEALETARKLDKPILLSIGYSSCHWCHVMAHESFESAETAALMNGSFVCIKVDREERPDLDQIYQYAHQLLNERGGGWPLTVFLTPDTLPFFSGTYFPPRARHGLPAFEDVLRGVAALYAERRPAIELQNRSLLDALASLQPAASAQDETFDVSLVDGATAALLAQFDRRQGGFGRAPKFPRCPDLELLLDAAVTRKNESARQAWLHTLQAMAEGGIFDHLAGGFFRYSVDAEWNIPHFEKMLYDNGLLLKQYAEAFALNGNPLFSQTTAMTANWAVETMQSPHGGFYTAIDADSAGEEARHIVWDAAEVKRLLPPNLYRPFAARYGLDRPAGFEDRHWHLRITESLDAVAASCDLDVREAEKGLAEARLILLTERGRRPQPTIDDKILTGPNALMIGALARAAGALAESDPAGSTLWLRSARKAIDFIRSSLWRNNRLATACTDGPARFDAYLDDNALLILALTEMMQQQFDLEDLEWAQTLGEELLAHFEDQESGGFFQTRDDHEQLILRLKPGHDGAMPSGNGAATLALQRLGSLTGQVRFSDAAERTLRLFLDDIKKSAGHGYWGYASLLLALAQYDHPPTTVILRGSQEAMEWHRRLRARCMPSTIVLYLPDGLGQLPQVLDKPAIEGKTTAWICRASHCLPPIHEWEKLAAQLGSDDR